MKAFLKVVLILLAALIAIKLLPLTLALGLVLGLGLVGLAVAGVSLLACLLVLAVFFAALLSPIWVPVLLLFGLIALIKRATRGRPAAA